MKINLLSFLKEYWIVLTVVIGALSACAGLYQDFLKPLDIPGPLDVIIIIICIVLVIVMILMQRRPSDGKPVKKRECNIQNSKPLQGSIDIPLLQESCFNKHPVLLIDDDDSVLKKMKALLNEQGYDVVANRDIQDCRLVERFEIIVSDINGIGSLLSSKNLLERIKQLYPYKVIIPMSSSVTAIDVGEKLILKDDDEIYMNNVIDRVKFYQDLLNNPRKYWDSLKNTSLTKLTTKQLASAKKHFAKYIDVINGAE